MISEWRPWISRDTIKRGGQKSPFPQFLVAFSLATHEQVAVCFYTLRDSAYSRPDL